MHIERSDQLFVTSLNEDGIDGRATVMGDEERVLRGD